MSLEHDDPTLDSKIYPAAFRDFISPKARKIIFWSVVGAHLGIIFLPLLFFALLAWIVPPPKQMEVITVSLQNDLPFDHHVASVAPDKDNPTPTDSMPPAPGEISPLPPEPPEPAPTVKEMPKETPKPKPKETPKVKETKETVVKEDVKKPTKDTKKDEKPKEDSKPKKPTAADILAASSTVKNPNASKTPKGQGGEFFNNLNKNLSNIKTDPNAKPGGGTNGAQGVKGDPNQDMEYYGRVGAYLKSRWQQPSRALMGNAKPSVNVRVKVDERGQIVSASIEKRSGVQVMDASVERLLAEVKTLPVPPRAMEFVITMNIEDE